MNNEESLDFEEIMIKEELTVKEELTINEEFYSEEITEGQNCEGLPLKDTGPRCEGNLCSENQEYSADVGNISTKNEDMGLEETAKDDSICIEATVKEENVISKMETQDIQSGTEPPQSNFESEILRNRLLEKSNNEINISSSSSGITECIDNEGEESHLNSSEEQMVSHQKFKVNMSTIESVSKEHQWPNLSDIFQQVGRNEKGGISLKCLLCLPRTKIVKASVTSVSNLRAHIKTTHPSKIFYFNEKVEKKGRKRKNNSTDITEPVLKSKCAKQTLLGDNIPKTTEDQNKAVLRFIVGTGCPLSIVEHEDFLNLIQTCGGKNPPNRKNLMDMLDKSFIQMKNELLSSLSEVSTVCATTDCWSVFRRSYIGMTIHWLDPSTLERRSMGIACRRILGQHTYDVIADAIESILDDFEIKNKCSMMITDNGSNFLRAFRLFGGSGPDSDLCCEDTEEIDGGDMVPDPDIIAIAPILEDSDDYGRLPSHHPCAAHTLNLLATTDAEAAKCDPAYRKIMRLAFAKCQAIFNKQNKSRLAADIIKKHLGRHFLVPGANRWNSQFDAIELLVKSEDKLDSLCKDLDLPMFKRPQEIEFLAEYCKVMEPIAQALDILQGEKEMYMGFLLPTLTVVKSVLTSLPELQWCEPLKHALLKGFDKRFSKYFENKEFEIAACLIPRFKLNWVPHLAERQTIRNTLSDEFLKAVRKEPSTRTTTAGSKAPPESKNTKIDKFFSVIDVPKESNGNTDCSQMERAKAESELARYLNDSVDVKEMSELCKNLFIKFNTAVPSSAHCERLFSAASLVITNRRGSDTNFEKQVLLKFNRHLK